MQSMCPKLFSFVLSDVKLVIVTAGAGASSTTGDETTPGLVAFRICVQVIPINIALDATLTFFGKASKCKGHYIEVLMFSHTL